jgi:hypothetical protein
MGPVFPLVAFVFPEENMVPMFFKANLTVNLSTVYIDR